MLNVMLSNSQMKTILRDFRELDMHKELKILFENMYPRDTSVYITHGSDERGRDLIISQTTPIGKENIAVVVKMDKLSGSASDRSVHEVIMQINQCFQTPKNVSDQFKALKTDKVFVCIFGEISNRVQDNFEGSLVTHQGKITYFDIEKLLNYFTKYYPNIFLGASGLVSLHKKYNELERKVLEKNHMLKTSYIEPNLRMFKKSKSQLLAISKASDAKKIGKVIGHNIFGEKETITSIAKKALENPHKMLIEGDAGSGKTVFVLKLTMHIIQETIHKINVAKKGTLDNINTPVVIKATKLVNDKSLIETIEEYYDESSTTITPSLLIIDGMDEISNDLKEEVIKQSENYCNKNLISLIFTTRKSTEVKKRLFNYDKYELLPFETSQAIDYFKKMLNSNKALLGALIKGLEELKHQIPLYPMSLSLLIEIAKTQQEVPASITELYNRYIDMALAQTSDGEEINVLFEPSIKKDFLECLAFDMFYSTNSSVIKRNIFDKFVIRYQERFPIIDNIEEFINDLERTSIIKIGDLHVDFLHKSFLDYFVASYFKNMQTELFASNEFDDIYGLYHSSLWEDVTYFYFGQKTRINKLEIDKIINATPEGNSELSKNAGQFMIGKLMQYAWHTEFEDKKYAISLSVSNSLTLRKELSTFLEDELQMNLPKILGDVQMLHFVDEAFSSKFLLDEVKSLSQDVFTGNINDKLDLFYFSTLFTIENSLMLGNNYVQEYLDKFLLVTEKMPPDISLPLINLLTVFVKNNKINSTPKQDKDFKKVNQKLKSRYKELTIDYLSFKNKLDQLRIQNIGK